MCARMLWYLCNALHNFSTIMYIKFEDVQAVDELYSRQVENAVKNSVKGI